MPTSHVFCDESHVDTHTHRVQGGIWVPDYGMRDVRAAFSAIRKKHPKFREFKWSYVTGKKPFTAYDDLLEMFFDSSVAPFLSFRCLVVRRADDASQGEDKVGKDLGFYKAYHTLLSRRLKPGTDNHIVLDERTSPRVGPVDELAFHLNTTAKRYMDTPYRVVSCRMEKSKNDDLLQLADLMCGAVGWAYNGMGSTCGAKPILHQRICDATKLPTLCGCETDSKAPKFNVWPYRPKKR